MFNVKIKVKEGNNTLPRTNRSTTILDGSNSYNGSRSPATTSLRSSLASSNRSPSNSLKRKDKRVRIVTTTMPTDGIQYQQQQQLLLMQHQHQQRLRQYGKQKGSKRRILIGKTTKKCILIRDEEELFYHKPTIFSHVV